MNDKLLLKIQNALKDEILTKYDYYSLYMFFQRLYLERTVQDNIIAYMDNKEKTYKDEINYVDKD